MACAPAATSGTKRDNDVITRAEIAASQTTNAYDAIKNLRPVFLRSRGQHTFKSSIVKTAEVFVDGQKHGDVESLKTMSIQSINTIRFLSASAATTKYGTGYTSGVIEVSTR